MDLMNMSSTLQSRANNTRIPRYASQMDPQELSPLTTRRGVILDKPRRRDTQVSDTALARASAILHSPMPSPMVSPASASSTRQNVHQQLLLQHFASLDIEMIYNMEDEQDETEAAPMEGYEKARSESFDMAEAFYSEH